MADAVTQKNNQILDAALKQANPNISPEVRTNFQLDVAETMAKVRKEIKADSSQGECSVLAGVFKDKADKNYGGIALKFDKQGNIMEAYTAAPGSSDAKAVLDTVKQEAESADNVNKGYRTVVGANPTQCNR